VFFNKLLIDKVYKRKNLAMLRSGYHADSLSSVTSLTNG